MKVTHVKDSPHVSESLGISEERANEISAITEEAMKEGRCLTKAFEIVSKKLTDNELVLSFLWIART